MIEELSFHHFGIASRMLESEAAVMETLGYRPEGPPFVDSLQGVRGVFMVGPGPRIEIVAPATDSRTLEPWLIKGVKVYHQAFEVANLAGALERRKAAGAILVVPPTPAAAFSGRRVAFVMLPSLLLIELIESSRS